MTRDTLTGDIAAVWLKYKEGNGDAYITGRCELIVASVICVLSKANLSELIKTLEMVQFMSITESLGL